MLNVSNFVPEPVTASIAERLAAFAFVRELGPAGMKTLLENCTEVRVEHLQKLLAAGDSCTALLLVERESIRVFKRTESGRESYNFV